MNGLTSSQIARVRPDQINFKRIALNGEYFEKRNKVMAHGRNPRWRPDTRLSLQFDAEVYDLEPGKPIVVPAVVADHLIRQAEIQPPIQDTEGTWRFDRSGEYFSMIDVLEDHVGFAGAGESRIVPDDADRQCMFCNEKVPVNEYVDHMALKHASEVARRAATIKKGGSKS